MTKILCLLLVVAVLLGIIALNIWYCSAILGSRLPGWVKFLLLTN